MAGRTLCQGYGGPMQQVILPVILAGGSGQRLWPLSTPDTPKQMLSLVGEGTLIEQTLDRVEGEDFARPTIVCAEDLAVAIADVAKDCRLILEPLARNSAPAIALAACALDPDDILLVLPSDHHIGDRAPFLDAIAKGYQAARQGKIVTFGIRPTGPETGYGYIETGPEIAPGVFEAAAFIEKPNAARARRLVESEGFVWNAGIFLFRASTMIGELAAHAPDVLRFARQAIADAATTAIGEIADAQAFARCPSISIDYAVMERSDRVAVVPVAMDWSDIGSWQSLYALLPKDSHGNAVDSASIALDSTGCLLKGQGARIVALGVNDLVVVATGDFILVVPRSKAQDVREAARAVEAGMSPVKEHSEHDASRQG